MDTSVCPQPEILQELILGRLGGAEAESTEQHVATCRDCLQVLGTLSREDDLVQALRPPQVVDSLAGQEMAATLTPLLKRLVGSITSRDLLPHQTATVVLGSAPGYDPGATTLPPSQLDANQTMEPGEGDLTPGSLLGEYRLVQILGAGGMGTVWKAEDTVLKRFVAVKVIARKLIGRPEVLERFLVEAQALAQLEHDHIVAVYRIAEHQGLPYLAMQFLRGETLHDRLGDPGNPLPVDEILRIGRETALGLAIAHERGLIHRDIKPGNLWLDATANDRVKILDFGLVRALSEADDSADGRVIGTPAYMAPEQARAQTVDPRTDLFALGCVLYHAATGAMPFQSSTLLGLLMAVATDQPAPARERNLAIPPSLDQLIQRLMAKDPADRPQTAREVATTIEAIERSRRPSFTRRWLLAAGAALVGGVGVGTWAALNWLAPAVEPPAEPGEIAFDYPETEGRLVLQLGDEAEISVDPRTVRWQSLPPGDYALRPENADPLRRLVPARILVKPGEKRQIVVRHIGRLDQHLAHAGWPVVGLVVRPTPQGAVVLSVGAEGDRQLVAWQPLGGQPTKKVAYPVSAFRCLALSPDGKTLITGSGGVGPRAEQLLQFWDAATLDFRGEPLKGELPISAVACSPDPAWKRLLTGENDGSLKLWDISLPESFVEWEQKRGHAGQGCTAVTFLPKGRRFLSAGADGKVILRQGDEGAVVQRWTASTQPIRVLTLLPGGDFLTAGDDGFLRIWQSGRETPLHERASGSAVLAIAVGQAGSLLTGHADGTLRLWSPNLEPHPETLQAHPEGVRSVAWFAEPGRAVTGGADGSVRLWELPHFTNDGDPK